MNDKLEIAAMTADIVSAHVSNNAVSAADIPGLIQKIYLTLGDAVSGAIVQIAPVSMTPAVPVKKSITPDHLVCLEDGLKFKSLKRHLRTKYGLEPDDYRTKWGLPTDYPMVAPNYAAVRSDVAKRMGLGQASRKAAKTPAKAVREAKAN